MSVGRSVGLSVCPPFPFRLFASSFCITAPAQSRATDTVGALMRVVVADFWNQIWNQRTQILQNSCETAIYGLLRGCIRPSVGLSVGSSETGFFRGFLGITTPAQQTRPMPGSVSGLVKSITDVLRMTFHFPDWQLYFYSRKNIMPIEMSLHLHN